MVISIAVCSKKPVDFWLRCCYDSRKSAVSPKIRAKKTATAAEGEVYPDRFLAVNCYVLNCSSVPKRTPTLHLLVATESPKTNGINNLEKMAMTIP
jgi:hypothetical protein